MLELIFGYTQCVRRRRGKRPFRGSPGGAKSDALFLLEATERAADSCLSLERRHTYTTLSVVATIYDTMSKLRHAASIVIPLY